MKRHVYVYRSRFEQLGRVHETALAYLTYQGDDFCAHVIEAPSGYEAKKLALREHRDRCGNAITKDYTLRGKP